MTINKAKWFCRHLIDALETLYEGYAMSEQICKILREIADDGTYDGPKVYSLFTQVDYYEHLGYPSWWGGYLDMAVGHIRRCIKIFPSYEERMPF